MVNALKETIINKTDDAQKTLSGEIALLNETLIAGFDRFDQRNNADTDIQLKNEEKICDDNNEYQERLNDTLFLESYIDDGKKASLKNVYIEPHIKFNISNYKDIKRWAENRESRILLLYGKAGIGKTSFTSWLSLNNVFKQEYHILELRKYISILDSNNPWESIKISFKCMSDDEYQDKILILDGLDEVCVLNREFDGRKFIENLSNILRTGFGRSIRIIITSRMGYFNEIERNNYVEIASIFWKEDSIKEWCFKYCNVHKNRVKWCEALKWHLKILKIMINEKRFFVLRLSYMYVVFLILIFLNIIVWQVFMMKHSMLSEKENIMD